MSGNVSNFSFLESEWPALHEDAASTEADIYAAPWTCAFYAQRTRRAIRYGRYR